MTDQNERIDDLDRRVSVLETALGHAAPEKSDADGSVQFSGDVSGNGRRYRYVWERPVAFFETVDWSESFERLAALAHPARAGILRHLLFNHATAANLVENEVVTSTGSAYHHLGALQSAGWVSKNLDGSFEIPAARVVPLLTILTAAEDH